jgi:hypothetical protein
MHSDVETAHLRHCNIDERDGEALAQRQGQSFLTRPCGDETIVRALETPKSSAIDVIGFDQTSS